MLKLITTLSVVLLTGCSSIGVCANFNECRERGIENMVNGSNNYRVSRVDINGQTHIITSSVVGGQSQVRVTTVGKK